MSILGLGLSRSSLLGCRLIWVEGLIVNFNGFYNSWVFKLKF